MYAFSKQSILLQWGLTNPEASITEDSDELTEEFAELLLQLRSLNSCKPNEPIKDHGSLHEYERPGDIKVASTSNLNYIHHKSEAPAFAYDNRDDLPEIFLLEEIINEDFTFGLAEVDEDALLNELITLEEAASVEVEQASASLDKTNPQAEASAPCSILSDTSVKVSTTFMQDHKATFRKFPDCFWMTPNFLDSLEMRTSKNLCLEWYSKVCDVL